ncbi:MAG TPA: hypothetical protein VFZ24_02890 [Longimicrobiales bacterium]
MIGTLLKAVAYSKAPRTTFSVLHPAKAVLFRKFQWDMRHAHAPRVTAIGAAALALPLGMWLGRKRARRANGAAEGYEGVITEGPGPMRAGERAGLEDQTVPRV